MNKKYEHKTDDELLALMVQSEPAQHESIFTEIYNRFSKPVYSYCIGICGGNEDKANDLFQETFIRFNEAIKKTIVEKPLHYLIKIARNKYLSIQEKIREELRDMADLDVFQIDNNRYDKEELYNLILSALELIDEKYREIFVLREFEMLPFQEIAEICGISLSNAKIMAMRAREKVIKILDPYIKDLNQN